MGVYARVGMNVGDELCVRNLFSLCISLITLETSDKKLKKLKNIAFSSRNGSLKNYSVTGSFRSDGCNVTSISWCNISVIKSCLTSGYSDPYKEVQGCYSEVFDQFVSVDVKQNYSFFSICSVDLSV